MEAIEPYDQAAFYPVCLKAVRACPPEDVGGPYGYVEFVEALADEDHPDHEMMADWFGDEFDPKQVDLNEINADLEALFYQKRWTVRKL
ncbi:MAG: plasmid pRiA4b ORF-3 family protein [Caldilineaceae bacterium]